MTPTIHDDDQFRAWLRAEMRSRSLSVRQVAHRSRLSPSTVSRILNGQRRPGLGTAAQLARALGQGNTGRPPAPDEGPPGDTATATDAVERALRADRRIDRRARDRILAMYRTALEDHQPSSVGAVPVDGRGRSPDDDLEVANEVPAGDVLEIEQDTLLVRDV